MQQQDRRPYCLEPVDRRPGIAAVVTSQTPSTQRVMSAITVSLSVSLSRSKGAA
jgi:hypothetical protein